MIYTYFMNMNGDTFSFSIFAFDALLISKVSAA